jgi:UDP:flavonoid glycosyltransferase YjiC (YdhE family)
VAGAGTRLPAKRLRPDRLRAKVHEAIQMRDGAKRIQQAFAEAGGPPVAADAIETRLLDHHPADTLAVPSSAPTADGGVDGRR